MCCSICINLQHVAYPLGLTFEGSSLSPGLSSWALLVAWIGRTPFSQSQPCPRGGALDRWSWRQTAKQQQSLRRPLPQRPSMSGPSGHHFIWPSWTMSLLFVLARVFVPCSFQNHVRRLFGWLCSICFDCCFLLPLVVFPFACCSLPLVQEQMDVMFLEPRYK